MLRFLKDHRGSVGIIFGLSIVPLVASVGVGLDFARLSDLRERMRKTGDQVAVIVASADTPQDTDAVLSAAQQKLLADKIGVRSATVQGSWLDASNYTVSLAASVDTRILSAIPGGPKTVAVKASTTVNRIPPTYRVLPPSMSLLEPEAADYNRTYMYCYNAARKNDADKGRRGLVPVADNATPPTNFSLQPGYQLTQCTSGEVVSYMLRNVRNSRTTPSKWNTTTDYYEYFTNTGVDLNTQVLTNVVTGEYIDSSGRRSSVDLTNRPMLETIVCDTPADCRPIDQGGILPPRATSRQPSVATKACLPGRAIYYGFEDRPGGDQDYDDIRMVVTCPETVKVTDKQVRIVN